MRYPKYVIQKLYMVYTGFNMEEYGKLSQILLHKIPIKVLSLAHKLLKYSFNCLNDVCTKL